MVFVGLYVDKAAVGAPDAQAFFVGLAPGVSMVVTFQVTLAAGSHALTAWADWNGQVAETNEANNTAWVVAEALPRTTPDRWLYLPVVAGE